VNDNQSFDINSILQTLNGKQEIISDPFPIGNAFLCNLSINSNYQIRLNLIKHYNQKIKFSVIKEAFNSFRSSFHLTQNRIAIHKGQKHDDDQDDSSIILYSPSNMTYNASRNLWIPETDPFKVFVIEQKYQNKHKSIFDIFRPYKNENGLYDPIKVEYTAHNPINYERSKYPNYDTITFNLNLCIYGNIDGIFKRGANFTLSTADIKF